ncbi:MAG: hypothetical protein PHW13_07020 [Methylococcales bacterium]|nr:hypothetical protein [Methylococcales bacterium]
MSPSIFVFAALLCEVKPLIQSERLKPLPGKHPFTIYAGDEYRVVVSGMGKVAMAGAVAYTLALYPDASHPLLLNLGIVGSRHESLGMLFLADKILDCETGKKFYPPLAFKIACRTAAVMTVTAPQTGYAEAGLYDMEASAFYEMASRFGSSELIHSLKIVSDNAQSSPENISPQRVEAWVAGNLVPIRTLVADLLNLRLCLPRGDDSLYRELAAQYHFSASNAVRLKGLLQNWQVLNPDCRPNLDGVGIANGKALIAHMEQLLGTAEFYL